MRIMKGLNRRRRGRFYGALRSALTIMLVVTLRNSSRQNKCLEGVPTGCYFGVASAFVLTLPSWQLHSSAYKKITQNVVSSRYVNSYATLPLQNNARRRRPVNTRTVLQMVLTTPEKVIEEASTQKLLDDLIDESVRLSARRPIMMQFDPTAIRIWRRWRGTVFSETWPTALKNMIFACVIVFFYETRPNAIKSNLQGFSMLWGQLLSVTTFTLTFFLNQSYTLWKKCYGLSRRLQGRLNDLGLTLAAHAARTQPTDPDEPSTYTPAARQVLELMGRYIRLFNLLTYASFTLSHRPVLTPRGMRRLVERGIVTPQERQILIDAKVPATQRHNAVILWIIRIFVDGRQAGHFHGGDGFEQQFMEKAHVIRSQYGAIGDELQGRMPLAYAHIVQVLVDSILWMYPMMALVSDMNRVLVVVGTGLMTIFYRGLFTLAKQFLDPYDNENYGKGDDPICVDTLVAETNAGSVRWMYGFEYMPWNADKLKDGELQKYILPVRGHTVEELREKEEREEAARAQKEKADKERKEEEEQEKKEGEQILQRERMDSRINGESGDPEKQVTAKDQGQEVDSKTSRKLVHTNEPVPSDRKVSLKNPKIVREKVSDLKNSAQTPFAVNSHTVNGLGVGKKHVADSAPSAKDKNQGNKAEMEAGKVIEEGTGKVEQRSKPPEVSDIYNDDSDGTENVDTTPELEHDTGSDGKNAVEILPESSISNDSRKDQEVPSRESTSEVRSSDEKVHAALEHGLNQGSADETLSEKVQDERPRTVDEVKTKANEVIKNAEKENRETEAILKAAPGAQSIIELEEEEEVADPNTRTDLPSKENDTVEETDTVTESDGNTTKIEDRTTSNGSLDVLEMDGPLDLKLKEAEREERETELILKASPGACTIRELDEDDADHNVFDSRKQDSTDSVSRKSSEELHTANEENADSETNKFAGDLSRQLTFESQTDDDREHDELARRREEMEREERETQAILNASPGADSISELDDEEYGLHLNYEKGEKEKDATSADHSESAHGDSESEIQSDATLNPKHATSGTQLKTTREVSPDGSGLSGTLRSSISQLDDDSERTGMTTDLNVTRMNAD